ncbi:helix-turn-helix transcriptional regulator [Pseudomonas akapageensis]|uniref:helix-turn-helix transcriptional regulator n=1 Tax=Pseudomonas akapageensis TaxID=2609961 RepID=UPI00140C6A34|nr:helix-turn-helix transcriptional regulator [Pseudomonas akapageensis]
MYTADVSLDELCHIIELIYEGPSEALPWQQSLEQLRSSLQASYVTLILRPSTAEDPGFMVNAGTVSTWAVGAYASTYYALDPFVGLPPGEVHTVAEILGEERWLNSAFYQQFNAPLDVFHIMGADLRSTDGSECRLRICRPRRDEAFNREDKALCTRLLPHLRRAVGLRSQLKRSEAECQLYATAVERLQIGTLILDDNRRVLEINETARELLAEDDGLRLVDGSLQAACNRDDHALQRLIGQVQEKRLQPGPKIAEAITLKRPLSGGSLGVVVQSLPRPEGPQSRLPALVVYLRNPERKACVQQQTLRQLFGFTPTEAELTLQLAHGHSLDEAGARLNIRRNTVKTHLRSIYAKAGVTRHTELTHLLHSSVAVLAGTSSAEHL